MAEMKLIAAVLLTLAAARGIAQEHQQGNGEKLGAVHFATSCNEAAQMEFNRAVALLHSFQFSRAIDGFDVVLEDDPTCAIAYWGIALSDWTHPFAPGIKANSQLLLGRESIERGRSLGARTEREGAYLAAVGQLYADFESSSQRARLLAYRDAMQGVAAKYPEDHEAQIFYALALAASADPTDKNLQQAQNLNQVQNIKITLRIAKKMSIRPSSTAHCKIPINCIKCGARSSPSSSDTSSSGQ